MAAKRVTFMLTDAHQDEGHIGPLRVDVEAVGCYLNITPEGYGNQLSLDLARSELRLLTNFDPDVEEPEVTELQPDPEAPPMPAPAAGDADKRIEEAMSVIERYGGIDGGHHKQWVIDQVARLLLGDNYTAWVVRMKNGSEGPNTYDWDTGIAP